jgi:hypothetical protein
MKNIYNSILLLIAIICLFQPAKIFAYSCDPIPPPCSLFWKSDYVFIGIVKEVLPLQYNNKSILFDVEKGFRGAESSMFRATPNGLGYDEIKFQIDKKYVVYANKYKDSIYIPSICARSGLMEERAFDLAFLNSLNDGKPEYEIWGTAFPGQYQGSIKIKFDIEILTDKQKYSAISDNEGNFKISVNEEGNYNVRIWLPKGSNHHIGGSRHHIEKIAKVGRVGNRKFVDYEVEVKPDHCVFIIVPVKDKSDL